MFFYKNKLIKNIYTNNKFCPLLIGTKFIICINIIIIFILKFITKTYLTKHRLIIYNNVICWIYHYNIYTNNKFGLNFEKDNIALFWIKIVIKLNQRDIYEN